MIKQIRSLFEITRAPMTDPGGLDQHSTNPHPVLRRLSDEVKSGDCSIEQALTAAFQLGYVQRDIDSTDAKALQWLMLDEGDEAK